MFESPFERKLIDDEASLTSMIYYCHFNAQKHGFVNDFKDWEFSSYHAILKNNTSFLSSQKVLDWFGGAFAFEKAHEGKYEEDNIEKG